MGDTLGSNGKGSSRRPGDNRQYADGWDRIWGGKKVTPDPKRNPVKVTVEPYPAWVCFDCATKAGGKLLHPECTTVHTGDCEVCGMTQWVTQPRDYGYPRFK